MDSEESFVPTDSWPEVVLMEDIPKKVETWRFANVLNNIILRKTRNEKVEFMIKYGKDFSNRLHERLGLPISYDPCPDMPKIPFEDEVRYCWADDFLDRHYAARMKDLENSGSYEKLIDNMVNYALKLREEGEKRDREREEERKKRKKERRERERSKRVLLGLK